ncbi:hypothetical protein G9C98_006643 [Cotesia typhae]|uniref:L-lactate dehydrogenase n=1 Tax=Cotesia typhae TaxID=2053667 RepID=A0A8J5RAZ3_9HYME|nr:hypothetical protein G9C98_006643 [Cotesia typhae]
MTNKVFRFKKANLTKSIHREICFEPNSLREGLLCSVKTPSIDSFDKVTIVGAGMVGVACANAILFQKISSHVAIVDAFPKKLEGEGMDYCHSSVFLDDPYIEYDTGTDNSSNCSQPIIQYPKQFIDFCVSSNSKVVIITAGARQIKGETRLELVQKNVNIIKNIVPPLVQYIPLWSGVNVAGVLFRDIMPTIGLEMDQEGWNELMTDIVKASGATVRCLKGYSNTAIGLTAADITRDILRNCPAVKSISTMIQGHHSIHHEMFLSLPCTLGENGVSQVIRMRITEHEKKLFQKSAEIVYNIQKGLKIS